MQPLKCHHDAMINQLEVYEWYNFVTKMLQRRNIEGNMKYNSINHVYV